MVNLFVILILALLPPEARRINAEAMAHYEAGRPEQALESFIAAYASVPADRENNHHRESILGSIRGSLLDANERSGAAAPLCRLRDILQAHVASVRTIFPDEPERLEIVGNVERVGLVETQLAAYPANACDPEPAPPPPVVTPAPVVPQSAAPPPQAAAPTLHPASPPDGPSPHRLRIAGGLTLGLGGILLGAMTVGVVAHARITARLDARASGLAPGQPLDPATWMDVQHDLERARLHRNLALGTGISAALALGTGVTLFLLARGRARGRVALAPWWLSSGTGLIVRVRLP